MSILTDRLGQEFNSIRTEMVGIDNKDLSNISTLPLNVINQLRGDKGPTGLPGPDGTGSNGMSDLVISRDVAGNYEDNKSIYVSPTNVAYYKTTEGWVEIGKLMVQNGNNNKSIVCGAYHTTFLLQDGTCKAVGYNTSGGLGDGTLVNKSTPVVVSGISGCISIACGDAHTVFLLQDGTCKAVGGNASGQLGDGTLVDKSTPVVVSGISGCISIACGDAHTVFLLQDGTCKAVGGNTECQLGDGTSTNRSIPVSVLNVTNCISIACGDYYYTTFLLSDGTCKAVGNNGLGQLGDGTVTNRSIPVSVLNVTNCISIFCGLHTVFLLQDGTCKATGYNAYGQLGDGTLVATRSTPVVVLNISNCISISCGREYTIFLLQDGTCKAVGYNPYGGLGDGTTANKSTPVVVLNISNCISIACGYYHTVFLLSDGTCKAVGYNSSGQLGVGTITERSTPVVVLNISNVKNSTSSILKSINQL